MIFLIGYMCAGKTTIGKKLSAMTGLEFKDIDDIIEHKLDISINDIFKKYGEKYFRKIETEILKEIINNKNKDQLIVCGGGTPCFNDNMKLMKSAGKVIYLKVEPKILAERIEKSTVVRPVINGLTDDDLLFFIKKQLAEREFYYNKADIIIKNENIDLKELAELVSDK